MARIRKALAAFAGALIAALVAAVVQAGGMPGWAEIGGAALVALAAGYATWQAPANAPAAPAGIDPAKYVGN